MKHKRFLSVIIVTGFMLTSLSCTYDEGFQPSEYTINENYIKAQNFYVYAESTDLSTSISGTIVVMGKDGIADHARIVATIEIDPEDFGGISISVPVGWRIESIMSTYPQGKDIDPVNFISEIYTAEEDFHEPNYNECILIGKGNLGKPPAGGGGTGMVIIELDATEDASKDIFDTLVTIGSEKRNGVDIVGTDYKTIEINLPQEQQ
jgi:hypothetical protein